MASCNHINTQSLQALIAESKNSGGSERGNCQIFVTSLCTALGLKAPVMTQPNSTLNDYVYERNVEFKHPDGSKTAGFIDCYKRDCFVLEAKQSLRRVKQAENQPDLLGHKTPTHNRGKGWDQIMLAARKQAEDYARALPVDHGYPPFLIIVDIGNVIEIYADFSGQGKNYAHFPDRQSYRIHMDDLLNEEIQNRLIAIWNEPHTLDPARKSAEVTRDIAARLAKIAKTLEKRHDPKDVAEFLMRCLFTMFAEDVGLIPEKGFEKLLEQMKQTPQNFVPALESLWSVMDKGGFAPALNATLKRFNGMLFKAGKALKLEKDEIIELHIASTKVWSDVEPAIFGTLLERALDPAERSKLGAHYTPRAYVERIVIPTIIEPLRADWEEVKALVESLREENPAEALKAIKAFHHKLCTTRVLDPACGTGNFLYVSLELMKRLEGEVLEAAESFGENEPRLMMDGETVNPRQFYGLEINNRAVPIADLVLWIGYLKWQIKTVGLDKISEPVLHAYGTIEQKDAILHYDKIEMLRDVNGKPLSRWDGVTKKRHPLTGEEIPDPDAQIEQFEYVNPRAAKWPEVEFIVGNPPFIGGKDMRQELGDGYAEACWKVRDHIPGGADFVMHFWDEAARILLEKKSKLRRFGFITTNSITQTFSRRVIEQRMAEKEPLSLIYAVPDHPWLKASDKAAVRIAMTVAEKGDKPGVLALVVSEAELNTDTPKVDLKTREGKIRAAISIGADLSAAVLLAANEIIALKGFELGTQKLLLDLPSAEHMKQRNPRTKKYIFPYLNGNDLKNGRIWRQVIDTYPANWNELSSVPELQNYLLSEVENSRNPNADSHVLEKWWQFRRTGEAIRDSLAGLPRFAATTRTSKHRFFTFLEAGIRAESKTVVIASDQASTLALLSSRTHNLFATGKGGRQGVGNDPVYQHTDCFNTFPFPQLLPSNLEALGERLDAFRKERIAAHEFLTMTGLYNALERLREMENGCDVPPLTAAERYVHEAGLISVLKEIHDEIDRETLKAYGWEDLIPALVGKPGATMPSPHKKPEQEQAEEELLTRLVALNQERSGEEKRGLVRWLRPEYQIPKLGAKAPLTEQQIEADLDQVAAIAAKTKWPNDGLEQIRIIRELLARAHAPVLPESIMASLDGRSSPTRRDRVKKVLETLVATGAARTGELDGQTRYFVAR
jgi:hypothetical protein